MNKENEIKSYNEFIDLIKEKIFHNCKEQESNLALDSCYEKLRKESWCRHAHIEFDKIKKQLDDQFI